MKFLDLPKGTDLDILCAVMDMNELDREVYAGAQERSRTVKDFVEITGRTRSVVQRSVFRLVNTGVILREGRVNKTVYFVYRSVPLKELKGVLRKHLEDWYPKLVGRLN